MRLFKSKRNGSLLIECVISLMILSISSAVLVSLNIKNNKILKERILTEQLNESVNNLINEIKFNLSKKEISQIFNSDTIYLKYEDNFSEKLLKNNIKDLKSDDVSENNIEIKKVSDNERGVNFKLHANLVNGDIKINVEEKFIKSWWMDEI